MAIWLKLLWNLGALVEGSQRSSKMLPLLLATAVKGAKRSRWGKGDSM